MEQCIKGMKWNDKGIKWNNEYYSYYTNFAVSMRIVTDYRSAARSRILHNIKASSMLCLLVV